MVIIENNSRDSKYKNNVQGFDQQDSLLTTAAGVDGLTPEMTTSPHMKKIYTNATKIQNQQNSFFSPQNGSINSKKHSLLSNQAPQIQKLNNNPSFPNVNPIQQVNLSLISDEDLALY